VERVFITGISGFAGRHLAGLCRAEGLDVSGLSRQADGPEVRRGDLADEAGLAGILAEAAPDLIFHLAADTGSGGGAGAMLAATVAGTANLLAAAAALPRRPRLLVASSSAVYGAPADPEAPIAESAPLAPVSSYGWAKAAQDVMADRMGRALGLDIVRTRAFNQTGPGERARFVASGLARQIAAAERGEGPPRILVGRTDTRRDFSDVRDIVRGYWLAGTRGEPGRAYNLASGRAISIGELVERLTALSALDFEIVQDQSRLRPDDISCQIGDSGRARLELGWTPDIPLEQTLRDLLDYWRTRPLSDG
jgi:GDP-4-dehydro-6-deoxy-D-mannose reductase